MRVAFREAQVVGPYIAVIYGRPTIVSGQNSPGALVSVRALAAGEHYSIDCKVGPSGGTYRIIGPSSKGEFTGLGHVLATYTAPDTNPVTMKIERLDTADPWAFFYCDISRTQ
jgi:hypothetical protein